MNKAVLIVVMSVICANVIMAGPHKPKHAPRPHTPPPRHHVPHNPPKNHHHHHKGGGVAVAAGVIGGAIVGAAIAESLKPDPVVTPTPVVATPAPVVVPQPVVVQQPVVVAQPVTQVQNVWVEGRYVHRRDAHGRMIRVWEPGHYEQRTVTITP